MQSRFLHDRKESEMKKLILLATLAAAACSPANKQAEAPASTNSPATVAFKAANDKMHKDMGIALTGNADVDFIRGMIPHHEGAVAMAKVALEHGKDPEVRKLAQDVIAAQQTEIAQMKTWLANNANQVTTKAADAHDNH
jgi:uncharacterized protein (DUF305 family)